MAKKAEPESTQTPEAKLSMIAGRVLPTRMPMPQVRPADVTRAIHLVRRAVLAMQAHDPLAPVLREVVAELVSGSSLSAGQSQYRLRAVADALALDPHAESLLRDVREAQEALSIRAAATPAAPESAAPG